MATMTAVPTTRIQKARESQGGGWASPTRRAHGQELSIELVRDLLEAAGPLTAGHIAAGLGVSQRAATTCVQTMIARRQLKQDEFDRYRLAAI